MWLLKIGYFRVKMPKKKFFSSIFARSSKSQRTGKLKDDQLETDAVPMPDGNSNESLENREVIHNSTPLPSFESHVDHVSNSSSIASGMLIAPHNNQQIVPSPQSSEIATSPFHPTMSPQNNNMLAVHNTHAQNVFQFSNISNLHIGSVYKIGTTDAEPETATPNNPPKEHKTKIYTRTVQAMQQSTEPLSQMHLSAISQHLGEGWQEIMRKLKFSEGQIHQFTVDFHIDGGLREVIYQLLLDWTRNEDNATLGEITTLLWNSGHYETVYYLKQVYKAERNTTNEMKSEKMFCK